MELSLSSISVFPIGDQTPPGFFGKAVEGQFINQVWEKASEGHSSTLDSSGEHPKLDERNLTVVEEGDDLHSGEHSSESDCEMEETAYKVKFCVKDEPTFTLKHTNRLKSEKITDKTPFFSVHMLDPTDLEKLNSFSEAVEHAKCSHIKFIPVELVKQALESTQKTLQIKVDECCVTIEFTADEGLTEELVLEKIRAIANQELDRTSIKSDEDAQFIQNHAILSL